MTYEIRASGNPLDLAASVRDVVRQVDSRIAIHDLTTQGAHIDQAISSEITLARLCAVFAALALVIACVGLYGTVAFNVARRTNEIGIRTALGAPGQTHRLDDPAGRSHRWRRGAGDRHSVGVCRFALLEVVPVRVAPNDPIAITMAVALLFVSGLFAGFIPARRASLIDPLRAMRCE